MAAGTLDDDTRLPICFKVDFAVESGVSSEIGPDGTDQRLYLLIERLPSWLRGSMHWLLRPAARWFRIPAGILLIIGGIFSILPVLGLWMLPLGIILLAEDLPWCKKLRGRTLDWIERHRPHWIYGKQH